MVYWQLTDEIRLPGANLQGHKAHDRAEYRERAENEGDR